MLVNSTNNMAFNFEEAIKAGADEEKIRAYLRPLGREQEADEYFIEDESTLGEKVLGGAEKVSEFVGGRGITQFLGGLGAKATLPKEQRGFVGMPSPQEVAGSVLQVGSLFTPVGTIAKGASLGLKAAGLARGARVLGGVAAGATAGGLFDVGARLQGEGGYGAAIAGAAIPLIPPFARGLGVLGSEAFGVSTGAGAGPIKRLFEATKRGGKEAKVAREALRGNISPDVLVEDAKNALSVIIENRTKGYTGKLAELIENKATHDISPIASKLDENLQKFNIAKTGDIAEPLDFSRSTLRFNKQAQQEIGTIFNEMRGFGLTAGDRTVKGLDSLKRAFSDLFSESSEARAFVASMRDSVSQILKKTPGYEEMVTQYAEQTNLIKEIQRALSLKDKASIDTAFRKLASALRVNNEFRKQMVKELDEVSGNYISSQIAGQQMSELLPRGLMRSIGVIGAGAGILTGVGIIPLLKAALFTSPRLVGEILSALGYATKNIDDVIKAIGAIGRPASEVGPFPGDILFGKPFLQRLQESTRKFVEKPKAGLSIEDVSKKKLEMPTFKGLKNLSTKLLEKFRGMPENITEQQFNEVLNKAKKEGIRQADEQTIMSSLVKEDGQINLSATAAKVEEKLVPLKAFDVVKEGYRTRYSGIGEDFIGDGRYGEVIYQSPIKTSAGDVHFQNIPVENYFSHIRYEDMADGKTRKILETQSDLFQKGNFEMSIEKDTGSGLLDTFTGEDIDKLRVYDSNDPLAHLRTFREEVKRAAKDGKDTLLIPTGETALKIEGLGTPETFMEVSSGRILSTGEGLEAISRRHIKPQTGQKIIRGNTSEEWVISKTLDNGRFQAFPTKIYDAFPQIPKLEIDNFIENCL